MRASSLAGQVLSIALEHARASGGGLIRLVRGRVAVFEALTLDALTLRFDALAKGTPAEGARLEFDIVRARVRCRACGEVFFPEHALPRCARCDATEVDAIDPTGLWVTGLEVDAT
ncbi:MAG: hydrogenase maturation nickel metallochaperone HypA [Polyangiales bacterium]